MLALSPFHPTFGFSIDDQSIYDKNWGSSTDPLLNFNHEEWNSLYSFGGSPSENDQVLSLRHSGATSTDPSSSKKQNHNASERERRQKLNGLYSTLRSMLPNTDQKKKLSIPTIISQAVKYIPQLQNQVEKLVERKEEILSSISKQNDDLTCYPWQRKCANRLLPTVSTSKINDREVVMQVCASKMNSRTPFSAVLHDLEGEQFQILNVTAFSSCENKVLYTLYLQAKGTQWVDCEMLREKINSLC